MPDIVQLPSIPEQHREAVLRLLATNTTTTATNTTATATADTITATATTAMTTAATATTATTADTTTATSSGTDSGVSGSGCPCPGCNVSGEVMCFDNVAMGGTFDRLHAGHMLLLAGAALVATRTLFVGVTGEALRVR